MPLTIMYRWWDLHTIFLMRELEAEEEEGCASASQPLSVEPRLDFRTRRSHDYSHTQVPPQIPAGILTLISPYSPQAF